MYVFNQYMPLDKQQEADWLAVLDQTYGNYIRTNNPNEKRQLCSVCRKRPVYGHHRLFGHPLCQDCTKKGFAGQGVSGAGGPTDPSFGYGHERYTD